MKAAILIITCALALNFNFPKEKEVYICNGKASTKYHLVKDCKGLEFCSTEIEKVTLKEAKDQGRTLCGWED